MSLIYDNILLFAGVSEWQTRQTQNLLLATTCGFKSRHQHFTGQEKSS